MARKVNRTKDKPQKKYRLPQYILPANIEFGSMEDISGYTVPCPKCDKRTIDISDLPERLIKLRYKCPHCNNVVVTPIGNLCEVKNFSKCQRCQLSDGEIFVENR